MQPSLYIFSSWPHIDITSLTFKTALANILVVKNTRKKSAVTF